MDRLPQEILRLIAEEVAYESLEPLRLVNKAFAAAAAPFLFRSIPLWIGVRSLERLTAISEHPQLSQYPKEIFFSPFAFLIYENDIAYRDKVEGLLRQQHISASMCALTVAKHMSAHRSYTEMQRFLSLNALDFKILSKAFSQLPHLEALLIDLSEFTIGAAELINAFGVFNAEDLLTIDCLHTLDVLVKSLAASGIKIKVFELGADGDHLYSSISRSPKNRLTAASLVTPRLSTPRSEYSYPPGEISRALSKVFCAENMDICMSAFRGVRELKIGDIGDGPLYNVNLSKTVAALHSLMQCVGRLEVLSLGYLGADILDPPFEKPTLDRVVPSHVLNGIRELNIDSYETSTVVLYDLFHRNRYTIVKVVFSSVTITGSHWLAALEHLRTLDFPRLEVFYLSFCFYVEEDLEVQDYILKKTNDDPREEARKSNEIYLQSLE